MSKPKVKYKVYRRTCYMDDNAEDTVTFDDWVLAGETYAVSEAKAISNIKYRYRQTGADAFLEMGSGGSWGVTTFWKAEEVMA